MTDGICQSMTVLEFLVANGAERIIDELREQAYQIQVVAGQISFFLSCFLADPNYSYLGLFVTKNLLLVENVDGTHRNQGTCIYWYTHGLKHVCRCPVSIWKSPLLTKISFLYAHVNGSCDCIINTTDCQIHYCCSTVLKMVYTRIQCYEIRHNVFPFSHCRESL